MKKEEICLNCHQVLQVRVQAFEGQVRGYRHVRGDVHRDVRRRRHFALRRFKTTRRHDCSKLTQ